MCSKGEVGNMAFILLLDDEPALRDVLAEVLENEGHTVRQSEDGLLAYDLEVISSIDLMITDLFMPNIDGMNAIINARKDRPDLKIIAMSGGAEFLKHDFLPHTKDFGARAILRKPFSRDEFLQTVRDVLAAPAQTSKQPQRKAMAS